MFADFSFKVDVDALRHAAIHSGLVNHGLRKKVWPVLLGIDKNYLPPTEDDITRKLDIIR